MTTRSIIKITAIIAALILLLGAAFHMTGLSPLAAEMSTLRSSFYKAAMPGIWMIPAVHWVFIACLSVGLSRYVSEGCAAVLLAFGVWLLVDAAIVFSHVGLFAGVIMLALAGALLLTSGLLLRKDAKASKR